MGIASVLVSVCAMLVVIVAVAEAQISADWSGASGALDLGMELSRSGGVCNNELGECGTGGGLDSEFGGAFEDEEELGMDMTLHGRMLRRYRYYISYGALAANSVPCPPRSGRPYYTRNCYRARGPVRPYHRGCTAITRCYRDTS